MKKDNVVFLTHYRGRHEERVKQLLRSKSRRLSVYERNHDKYEREHDKLLNDLRLARESEAFWKKMAQQGELLRRADNLLS